jgi:hypothetical protein
MRIPRRHIERFVREVVEECLVSQSDREQRGEYYKNYFLSGSDNPTTAAIYNKTFAYLDDLESLLYSPISLRFRVSNPDLPNVLEEAKGRSTANFLRSASRTSNTDTRISEAVLWSLVKGKTIIKSGFKRGQFCSDLIQPENFGVLRENHDQLDEDMEAFVHTMWITPYQFERMIDGHPDRDMLRKRAKKWMSSPTRPAGGMTVMTGGTQPFQAGSNPSQSTSRGMVDWMSSQAPQLSPALSGQLMRLDELWVWDDQRRDWATFQQIGEDILIMGKYTIFNALAHNPASMQPSEHLKGRHPYTEFSPNRIDEYFWGRSEIINVALLQESINSRINGTNRLLRLQEDPPKKFIGSSGVNQQALARFNKPGGYWTDTNPNSKIEPIAPVIPSDLWGSLHEYERMFDEMGGLPPAARGHGAGVRSAAHADTVVRMFSPRFKDRALLIERDIASLGTLMLNIGKAHVEKHLVAWVPQAQAGVEASPLDALTVPPAEGMVPVRFTLADLDDEMKLSVDSHSSSPAFAADARNLIFDLFKIRAASAEDVIEHTDAPDPEGLIAGVMRREVAAAKAHEAEMQAKAQQHAAGGAKH